MNEPLKNPMPQHPSQQPEESHSSLIQRAMHAFDRGQFVPPSSPVDMLSSTLNPASLNPAPGAYAPPYAAQPAPQGYTPQPHAPAYGEMPQYAAPQGYAAQPQYAEPQYAPAPAAAQPARQTFHRINHQRLMQEGFITPGSGPSAQLEEFRIVKRQLLEQGEDLRRQGASVAAQCIVVTSAHAEEGKTFCAINLAMSIAAEKDNDVVLVDLDMARFSVLTTLGLPNGPGLVDAIADPRLDVRDCVVTTDVPGLSVLSGGRPSNSDAEYLASARARLVLEQLVEGKPNRIVLFDTPPVLAASLAGEVAKLSGQAVLVVMADKTSGSAVQDAAGLLAGCPNVQALLNGVQYSLSGRRFGSYHNYRG